MYLGVIVEIAGTNDLVSSPRHPYTMRLLDSVPGVAMRGKSVPRIRGEVASAVDIPLGCRFRPRCTEALPICAEKVPGLRPVGDGHLVACHLYPAADGGRP